MATIYSLVYSGGTIAFNSLIGASVLKDKSSRTSVMMLGDGAPGSIRVLETVELMLTASSNDNAATQIQSFIEALREAERFSKRKHPTPVYLQAKAAAETYTRYATVYGSPDLDFPSVLGLIFGQANILQPIRLTIIRGIWRSAPPTALPTVTTLTEVGGGPASPTMGTVVNVGTQRGTNLIYNWTGAYSGNLWGTNGWTLWRQPAQVGDIIYIGSSTAGLAQTTLGLDIATAAAYTADLIAEYYNGGWVTMALGVNWSFLPPAGERFTDEDGLFKDTGRWHLSFQAPTDSVALLLNGTTTHWVRIRVVAITGWATSPVVSANNPWVVVNNFIRIPAAALTGKRSPFSVVRMFGAIGGGNNPTFANPSQIIVGLRSNKSAFRSILPLHSVGPPTDWAYTAGTDFSVETNFRGYSQAHGRVSFATSVLKTAIRMTLTGTGLMDDFRGEYMVFIRARQNGGLVGETALTYSAMVGPSSALAGGTAVRYGLNYDLNGVKLTTVDLAWELVYCGTLKVPFDEIVSADTLTTNLYLRLHVTRSAGAATLDVSDIILIPIDEWAAILTDPLSDMAIGTSAFRGGSGLDLDNGLLAQRLSRWVLSSSDLYYPLEPWELRGEPPKLEPGVANDLHFLIAHHNGFWGAGPWISQVESIMGVQVYLHSVYDVLRGSG